MSLFLLENLDNYKKSILNPISEIYNKYTDQIFDYLSNISFINVENNNYIIKKGIEIQTYVFKYIFLYTFNLEMAVYHMKKAQLYYIEFVSQINNENNSYLKLTLKDSALFVYKKTIFDISTSYKSSFFINKNNSHKIDIINKSIDIFNLIIISFLDNLIDDKYNSKTNISEDNISNANTNANLNSNNLNNNNYSVNNNNVFKNNINNIKEIIQKHINHNLIILLNLSFREIGNNINNITNAAKQHNNVSDDNYNDDNDDNTISEDEYNIYKSLECIYYLSKFIINDIFTRYIDNNETIINKHKIKNHFLMSVIEIFIKLINKNYINNFYIDKSLIEKKISSFDIEFNISDETEKNKNDIHNMNDNYFIENPMKFINWLIN